MIATTRASRSVAAEAAGSVSPTIFEDAIAMFAEYIEWRATHPSDDLMTDLLNAEVEEQDGSGAGSNAPKFSPIPR